MKLFIDSSQKMFAVCLFNNDFSINYHVLVETKFKVEEIINFFNNIPNIKLIDEIYINVGPGSFVGSRASLLYVRTMAQVNSNIKIFETNTFSILKQQNKKTIFKSEKFYINATKNKSYLLKKNKVEIVEKNKNEAEINYEKLFREFKDNISIFQEINLNDLKPYYASEPQIGGTS